MNKRDKLIDFALEFVKAGMEINEVGLPSFDQLIETEYYKGKIDEILALPLDVPGDEEIRGEAMAYSVYPAKPDGYPDFDVERAVIFDEAAIWMRSEILKRNGR